MKKISIILLIGLFASQLFAQHKVVHLNNATFKQKVFNYEKYDYWKYEGKLPAIVDFYADWCGPCKMIAPTLEALASEYGGKLVIYKVDTQTERELSAAFGISSIPALLFIPKSGKPQMATGAMDKNGFVKLINDVLKVK